MKPPITSVYSKTRRQGILPISIYMEVGREKSGSFRASTEGLAGAGSMLENAWESVARPQGLVGAEHR